MAAAHFSVLAPPIATRSPSLILLSSRPSIVTHRKNYLRPKILKTLTKPSPPTLPLPPPPPPPPPQTATPLPFDEIPADATAKQADQLEHLQLSDGNGKVSATTIFKYGGIFLVGAFVFQSIRSVWFLANYNSNHKDADLEINGKTMPRSAAGNVFYVEDQLEMEKKIEEIKLLAREARRIEEMNKEEEEVGDPDSGDEDESPVSSHRLGIQKEVGARLLKLQNKINGNKDSSAALQINTSLANSVKSAAGVSRADNKNVNEGNEAFLFKKKLKYRSPSTKSTKTSKGFPGTRHRRASDAKKRDSAGRGTAQVNGSDATDHAQKLYEDKQVNQQDVETRECVSSVPFEGRKLADDKSNANLNHGKSLQEKMETPDMKTEAGVKTKNTNNGHSHAKRF